MALSRCESAIQRRDRRSAGIAAPTVVALMWLGFAPACPTASLAAPLDRMVQLTKRNESQSTQRQIDELTHRSEQQAAQILQRELEQRWLWALLAGIVAALIGAALFVARVRRSQRQLRALNAQLQLSEKAAREAALSEARQLARQRSEFLAQMSHELRTPLNAIMGFAQILQRDRTLTDRQTRALKIIDESGRHLLTLINDILDLARIDAAKLELHPVEINLQVFLQLLCDTIQIKAEEKSLLLTFHAAPDLPATVRVDDKRLRQVLLNLLSNAVKFSDTGLITLHVSCRPPPAAKIQTMTRLRFEVADGGIGMSDEQILRLFQPFEQVSDAGRREGGTGLGLAISRHLVRLMGGDIEVHSRAGEGSVFSFEIDVPASRIHTQALLHSRAPIGYRGERRKILLVDDVMQNRAILLEELSLLGFQVAEAANGMEALEVAARYQPDLIVMDLTMPVMDGLEATRRLRAIPRNAKLPIIAMSANVTAETEARSRHAGANEFVGKPDQESVLLNVIAGLLHLDWIYDGAATQRDAAIEQNTVRGVSKIPGAS
jgi:signal transduction histidine kinase/CheY-like chemotaxis protein